MRTREIQVTYSYTIAIDDENHIVQEYESDEQLAKDLAVYRFQILPVLEEGVKVLDVEVIECELT